MNERFTPRKFTNSFGDVFYAVFKLNPQGIFIRVNTNFWKTKASAKRYAQQLNEWYAGAER